MNLVDMTKIYTFFLIFFIIFSSNAIAIKQLVVIDYYGNWTLKKLGYPSIFFDGQKDSESYTIKYVLPPDASQGPNNWYLINLNFIIEFDENSTNGYAYVSALTNNRSCALIKFKLIKNNESLLINWSERNLLGISRHSTDSPIINVSFTNYLQYQGVAPGVNTLTFKLEQYGNIKVKKLVILPTSGIKLTSLSPPKLKLDVKLPRGFVKVDDTFSIKFTLSNVGDLPAENVFVRAIYPEEALEPVGEKYYYEPYLIDKLEGQFKFKAFKKGEYRILIMTETESGIRRPSVIISLTIEDRWKILSLFLLLLMIFIFILIIILNIKYLFEKNRKG